MTLLITTPEEAAVFSGPVDRIKLATDLGEIEILPLHASLIGTSKATPVTIVAGGVETQFFLTHAVVRVEPPDTVVTIAAQTALKRSESEKLTLEAYRESLLKALENGGDLSHYQVDHLQESLSATEELLMLHTKKS